jgi:hypothetical protein
MYKIGEKVRIKDFYELPTEYRSRAMGKVAGKDGVVVDKLESQAVGATVYLVLLDDTARVSSVHFSEACLERKEIPSEITFTIKVLSDVVVVHMLKDGNLFETGHGHIMYDGDVGVAHAASYAMKRIFMKLDELSGGHIYAKNILNKD